MLRILVVSGAGDHKGRPYGRGSAVRQPVENHIFSTGWGFVPWEFPPRGRGADAQGTTA